MYPEKRSKIPKKISGKYCACVPSCIYAGVLPIYAEVSPLYAEKRPILGVK